MTFVGSNPASGQSAAPGGIGLRAMGAIVLVLMAAACDGPGTGASWTTEPESRSTVSVSPDGSAISVLFEGLRASPNTAGIAVVRCRGKVFGLPDVPAAKVLAFDVRGGGVVPADAVLRGRVWLNGKRVADEQIAVADSSWLMSVDVPKSGLRTWPANRLEFELTATGISGESSLIDIDSIDLRVGRDP